MFICSPCLDKKFTNWSAYKSYGMCEICDKKSECHDIPSKDLNKKISKEELGEMTRNLF